MKDKLIKMFDGLVDTWLQAEMTIDTAGERKALLKSYEGKFKTIAMLAEMHEIEDLQDKCNAILKSIKRQTYKAYGRSY